MGSCAKHEPRQRRPFIATTDSAHNLPVFPNLARAMVRDGRNQLSSGDIERHEAFLNHAVVRGHRHRLVAASRLNCQCRVKTPHRR